MAIDAQGSGYGGHRSSESTSGAAILAAFIPTFISAVVYLGIFVSLRNRIPKHYAPRTFLGTVPEKDRTPAHHATGAGWFHDFRKLPTRFVLQHSSLDAYLYLRFLKFIIAICFIGCCITLPILLPINALGGGHASQLDKLTFGNIDKNNYLWAHTVIAWVFFLGLMVLIVRERLLVIGTRKAYLLADQHAEKLSARTVLFMNAPRDAVLPEKVKTIFGEDAERSWPVKDAGDLEALVQQRNGAAFGLESAEYDLIVRGNKNNSGNSNTAGRAENGGGDHPVPKSQRPSTRRPPLVGTKHDAVTLNRTKVVDLTSKIDAHRASPGRAVPGETAIFVAYKTQAAAHRAYETTGFKIAAIPLEDRYLDVQPKEVLWNNVAMPTAKRVSKASLGLAFVVAFTIFFSIPVGIIGTISNIQYLTDRFEWLRFIDNLPDWAQGLLTGLLPPTIVSWFVSYVPKLFRHIAKLSGEPTIPQAELKTQAWYFTFQVFQVFLVTTFSSGAAAVTQQILKDPKSAPSLLAESLPKASNFYLTYFLIQGLTSAASNVLNSSDLAEYLFYEFYWNKTPREKFTTYAQMKGISYGSLFPKFTNLLVIAIAYSCIAPLVLVFATIGITFYYMSYRYNLLYVCQSKIDTRGEAYKRALQQMPTGIYLAELSLIGLFGARKAPVQTGLLIALLVVTALLNLVIDRTLRPLELLLGVDKLQEQEVPLLSQIDRIPEDDTAALHVASHNRRLGLERIGMQNASKLSLFFDSIIESARTQITKWMNEPGAQRDEVEPLSEEDMTNAFENPAFTSKTPKLWLPKDRAGVSKVEIRENEEVGIQSTDDGAELDEQGRLLWDHDFENVPVWKKPKAI